MKKTLYLLLVSIITMSACNTGQNKYSMVMPETPASVAARTLDLPSEYASIHENVITKAVLKEVVIVKHEDKSKSDVKETKTATGKIRKSYSNAPDKWEAYIGDKVNEMTNQGTYLLNFIHNIKSNPNVQIDGSNPFVIRFGGNVFEVNGDEYWTGMNNYVVNSNSNPVTIEGSGTLGSGNNVIKKTFVRRVNGVDTYKSPVDYKGRIIEGEELYNQGANATHIRVGQDNRYVTIKYITKIKIGSGLWSTSNPVWSGGVTIKEDVSYKLAPLNEVLEILGLSEEELTESMKTTFYCTKRDPVNYVVSTSSEIIQSGNTYKGIVYYNGLDASVNKPTAKITSYGKQYPGHVVRWIFEAEGVTGERGGLTVATFNSSENNSIQVVQGSKLGYNASTKTLTYDRDGTLVFEYEEGSLLTAQGKGWGDRKGVKVYYKPAV